MRINPKSLIIVFVLLILLTSFSFGDDNCNYFPLEVGNLWQYEILHYSFIHGYSTTYKTIEVLKDTTFENGKTYYYLNGLGELLFLESPSLLRIDTLTNKLFHACSLLENWEYCQGDEFSFFYFGLPDTASSYYFCEEKGLCSADYRVGFGQVGALEDSAQFKQFFFSLSVGVGYKFSENFGMSNWTIGEGGESANAQLIFANISGQQFGEYVTKVEKKPVALNFQLMQNYPNPFNSSTKITYHVTEPGHVKLQIYCSTGQLIRTLVNCFQTSGEYSTNFSGQGISSGLYFYQLEVGSQKSKINKMVYIQ